MVALTAEQYVFLLEQGRLAETPAKELLDGQIVYKDRSHVGDDPMTIGFLHAWVIDGLNDLKELVRQESADQALVRTQSPILLPPFHVPEPDGVIVRGTKANYLNRYPEPADVLSVIEAADASLDVDRGAKRQAYARASLSPYGIVNIPDRQFEWHEGPRPDGTYTAVRVIRPGETVDLPIGDGRTITIPADRLIPPATAQA